MASDVAIGRHTARLEGDFVVFVIGMRFNRFWKVRSWWQAFTAMPRMMRELHEHPELGFLGGHSAFTGREIVSVQYWRSFEQLEAFARARDHSHLPAWRAFNKLVAGTADVGVFHETFRVPAGGYESIYVNMPVFGLAAAREAEHARVGRGSESARERIDSRSPVAA